MSVINAAIDAGSTTAEPDDRAIRTELLALRRDLARIEERLAKLERRRDFVKPQSPPR